MPLSSDDLDLLVEMALHEIALVQRLRVALEAGDDQPALELARQVAGLSGEGGAIGDAIPRARARWQDSGRP